MQDDQIPPSIRDIRIYLSARFGARSASQAAPSWEQGSAVETSQQAPSQAPPMIRPEDRPESPGEMPCDLMIPRAGA